MNIHTRSTQGPTLELSLGPLVSTHPTNHRGRLLRLHVLHDKLGICASSRILSVWRTLSEELGNPLVRFWSHVRGIDTMSFRITSISSAQEETMQR